MLTAITKSGQKICLGDFYSRETLVSLREKEAFFCPICGECVSLKLGDQRIFHFAHKSERTCRDFYENETFTHMEGKRQLYQWLIRQKIPSVLEFYQSEIGQRPDVMFILNDKKYAIEFQCSPMPEKVFMKRNRNYLDHGYIPLWIINSSHIHRKRSNIVSLSNFDYLFLRSDSHKNCYIPSYCPEKRHFHFLETIYPITIKNAFVQHSLFSIEKFTIEGLIEPKIKDQLILANWDKEIESFILNWVLHPNSKHNAFLREIYKRNLNMFLLPPEIGLHVPHSFLIQTPPLIWQTYLYLDVLADKQPHDIISIRELNFHFKKRINRKEIVIRHLPQMETLNPIIPQISYLMRLEQLGILSKKSDSIFQLEKKMGIPNSNREREEARLLFQQKYHHILSKT